LIISLLIVININGISIIEGSLESLIVNLIYSVREWEVHQTWRRSMNSDFVVGHMESLIWDAAQSNLGIKHLVLI
jgi:hypothetical protein